MMLIDFLEQSISSNEKDAEEAGKISKTSHSVLEISNTNLKELKELMEQITDAMMQLNEILIANGADELLQKINMVIEDENA